ncbi:MAG: hypothetical protein M3Z85_17870, partial [Acidobacteriota bacterium]|nr:hypothetical protein [Acidobacteriota bacterium]
MTAVEIQQPELARRQRTPGAPAWKRVLAFGTSCGIVVRENSLDAAIARVRPSGAVIAASTRIKDFRNRPASEWGAEFLSFLKENGETNLSATVLLPAREVIVRHIALPGVAARDLDSAIHFQMDSLHPFGDEEVFSAFSRADKGTVLVGIVRRTTLDRYANLFAEAGVAVSAFSFSASAIHAALRLYGPPPAEFLAHARGDGETFEIYGESAARPLFSAEFEMPLERALSLARAELRLPAAETAWTLEHLLPVAGIDADIDPLVCATALCGACPWVVSPANLLPADRRKDHSRAHYLPSVVLGLALLGVSAAMLLYPAWKQREYLNSLRRQISQLQPYANRAQAADRRIEQQRARTVLLDEFRKRSQADLDTLTELTRLLPPPIWTTMIEV